MCAKIAARNPVNGLANVLTVSNGTQWSRNAFGPPAVSAKAGSVYRESTPVAYGSIEAQDDDRTASGIVELDRVLGGGIVAGSLVLIGGAPGIGKSTIVMQMADKLGRNGTKVLYVSGEESERQIKMRGERLGVEAESFLAAGNQSSIYPR